MKTDQRTSKSMSKVETQNSGLSNGVLNSMDKFSTFYPVRYTFDTGSYIDAILEPVTAQVGTERSLSNGAGLKIYI